MEGPFPPTLEIALDVKNVSGVFTTLVRERFGRHAQLRNLAAEHIQRRVIRYNAQILKPEKQPTVEWSVIGKVYTESDKMARSFRAMKQLWENGFSHQADDGITIPEPFQCLPDLRMILMEEVGGEPLRPLVKNMTVTPDHMRLLARIAVKLHRCPIILGQPLTIEDRLSRCDPSPETLAQAYPSLAVSIDYIVRTAKEMQTDNIFTLVHGDFHLGQIHIENGDARLLDLDPLKYADPALDLAEVFVFLKRTSRKEKKSKYIETLRDAFLSEYFSRMDWDIAGRIPLYEGLLHLKRACKVFRVQDEAGWETKVARVVEQAVACLKAVEPNHKKLDFDTVIELYNRCPGEA